MLKQIITVANHKGGVAKTTTSGAVASILGKRYGYKVLCIDMDPQAHLTKNSGVSPDIHTIEVLRGTALISDYIQPSKNYDILPASRSLANVETELMNSVAREQLKSAIERDPALDHYDFIIIDTPPNVGAFTMVSLMAATTVIIPTLPGNNNIEGVCFVGDMVANIKKYFHLSVQIGGIFFARCDERTRISRESRQDAEALADKFNTKVYKTFIRQAVATTEAANAKKDLIDYKPDNNAEKDYESLTRELLADFGLLGAKIGEEESEVG